MIEPAVIERASEAIAESLKPELEALERHNDDLHRRLREVLAAHGGEYLAELQSDYDDLIELASSTLVEREQLKQYALALEEQLSKAKLSPRAQRPASMET